MSSFSIVYKHGNNSQEGIIMLVSRSRNRNRELEYFIQPTELVDYHL